MPLRELHDRDLDAFFIDRLAVGAEAASGTRLAGMAWRSRKVAPEAPNCAPSRSARQRAEVNALSNYMVEILPIKTGRAVTHVEMRWWWMVRRCDRRRHRPCP
ncbi:hypothetical protein DPM13_01200 [Paracoccus mutanolyticus]|uniref:LysR substrate-binding domain-containing protein n=1 Tax=Paracoccus mutanolyticus TaxID=1499308 RepID=A0ABM6WP06_9RHOB|nr:hypothetical protein DPM13_01200 [Paracoccus mutanolyticus]